MATKNKRRNTGRATPPAEQQPSQPSTPRPEADTWGDSASTPEAPVAQPNAPGAQPQAAAEASPQAAVNKPAKETMKKGIYLSALIYIEANAAPEDDFIATTRPLLKNILEEALSKPPEGYSMTLKEVNVQNDVEQDDSPQDRPAAAADGKQKKEEKFQF
ncbi:MAG: hypothetical protein ABI670_15535 [Chloroflexota bacterium]